MVNIKDKDPRQVKQGQQQDRNAISQTQTHTANVKEKPKRNKKHRLTNKTTKVDLLKITLPARLY